MAQMVRQPRILHKFYIYDPNVGDTLGGLIVQHDKDDKGKAKPGTQHVLAVEQQVQYWVDQGLLGSKPVGEISGAGKKLLAQVTRGRSEDNDVKPKRVARLNKAMQSGAPVFAGQPASAARYKSRQEALRARNKATAPKAASAPKPPAPPTPPKA